MTYIDDAAFARVAAEHQLELLDKACTTIRTRHKFMLQARRQSRFFQRTYMWTGSGIEKDPEIISGRDELGHSTHKLHGPILRSGTKRIFLVDLGRDFDVSETVEVEFKQTLLDLESKMQPFLGQTATEGCRSLRLTVLMPTAFHATVWARKFHMSNTDEALSQEVVEPELYHGKFGPTYDYSWGVTNPERGFTYRIVWSLK